MYTLKLGYTVLWEITIIYFLVPDSFCILYVFKGKCSLTVVIPILDFLLDCILFTCYNCINVPLIEALFPGADLLVWPDGS